MRAQHDTERNSSAVANHDWHANSAADSGRKPDTHADDGLPDAESDCIADG